MKYRYGSSKCVKNRFTQEIIRTDWDTADDMVHLGNGGTWHYTTKGAWRAYKRGHAEQE